MFLHDHHVVLVSVGEGDGRAELFLLPVDGRAAPEAHMREEVIMADEYLLGLYEVGAVAVGVDASAVESGPRHELAPPADEAVVEGEVVVLAVDLLHVALDDGHPPAEGQAVVRKHRAHVLVPVVLALGALLMQQLLVGEGEVDIVAEVKVIVDDGIAQAFDDLFVFGLVDGAVEELMLEWDVLDLLYAVYLLRVERGCRLDIPHDAEIGLLVDHQHAHHQVNILAHHLLALVGLLLETLLGED